MTERVRSRINPATVAGLGALLAGVVLLSHPRYFESLSIYPGTGWWFFPMFHAAFTALGVVTLGVGWFLVRGRSPTDRALAALALVTIVVTMLYAIVLLWLTAEDPGVVEGYGRKRALVGGLVAGLFTVGFAVPTTRLRAGGVGVMALVGPLALVVVDWATGDGAVLGPVVDVFILLTNPGVLGIEYLGVYLLVTAGALGLAFGTWAAYGAPSRATIASNPTDDTDDGDLGGESD